MSALFVKPVQLCNCSAERLEGKLSKLEALLTEGDTYDGYAESRAKQKVEKREYDTAENVPKEVSDDVFTLRNYGLAKRLESELSKLEVLLTEGDAYNG